MNLERFYNTYLARDLFAKIVPGGILLLAIAWLANGAGFIYPEDIQAISDISWWGWLFIFGVSYALGFFVQELGELIFWRYKAKRYQLWSPHPQDETYEEFQTRFLEFISFNPESEKKRRFTDESMERFRALHERTVVLKEMGGNLAIASSVVLLMWVVASWNPSVCFNFLKSFIVGIALLAITCFYWLHVKMRWRQREIEFCILQPGLIIQEHPRANWMAKFVFTFLGIFVFVSLGIFLLSYYSTLVLC